MSGQNKVLSERKRRTDGSSLLIISLNKPQALNALDLDMVQELQRLFDAARNDDSVSMVFIQGSGEKAFCAGGDVVSMYKAMQQETLEPNKAPNFIQAFFTQEYQLDYCIHSFPKPIIAWGNGIIMGGGQGVFAGADIKIVTESARIAMPEISIGLFPDVGASYFLNKLDKGVGLFLGLTASHINANDACAMGLATHKISNEFKDEFINLLLHMENADLSDLHLLASEVAANCAFNSRPAIISEYIDSIGQHLGEVVSAEQAHQALVEWKNTCEDKFIQKAVNNYASGCPTTTLIVYEQLKRGRNLSLADCFRMELNIAMTCGYKGEFQEGVRALLIDKDNAPKWRYESIAEVPASEIEDYFNYFNQRSLGHPLAALEQQFGEYHE
ncbi:enoyl-CoA hydratase/isomerase family protein [Glaciecola sp. 1036]|uniref:enoyl-CoA hydratase/isomerase family protein n=1 Tax=Alteromonadaceae TaxID=72275 RepID=UPI003CFF01B1